MKQFFNVLYRRILYRIPLKWLLVLLVVLALSFVSFSKADDVSSLLTYVQEGDITVKSVGQGDTLLYDIDGDYGIYCLQANSVSNNNINNFQFGITYEVGVLNSDVSVYLWKDDLPSTVCLPYHLDYIAIHNFYSQSFVLNYKLYRLDILLDTEIPVYSSLQCQTEYNLIPISSVDSNYCTTNNLCPSQECPVGTGGISELIINNISHVGAGTIYMNIAEEIDWDYAYTQGGNIMNIDIVGYNVDYEKMQEQIDIQNFKPDSSDLSTIISEIIPLFVPGLCIILLLYFIFRFIKKIF